MNIQAGRVFDVLLAIVGVAGITALVRSPNTAAVLQAGGTAFATSVRAALGG